MSSIAAVHLPFRIRGLPLATFAPLFAMSDLELAAHHATRHVVDHTPGYPDRIELRDAEVGERVILVNHAHLPQEGPYRSSHAVFVIDGATRTFDEVGVVPQVLRSRTLSLRAFDRAQVMVDADLVAGTDIEPSIARLFADPATTCIHVHYAKRGCYACRIDRVDA